MKFRLKENSIKEINAEVEACLKMNPNEKTLIFFHYGTDALESHASVDDPTYIRQQSNSKRMESLSRMSSKESYQILNMFSRLQPGNLKKKIPNVGIICTHKTQLLLLLDVLCLDIVMLNL
jgi:hypothetical protein